MRRLLVVQNIPDVDLGLWETPIQEAGYETVIIDPIEDVPSVKEYAGVIILGGSSSINDLTDPRVPNTLKIARETLTLEKPGLGSCLGLQAFVKAANGIVDYCNPKQNGVFDENGNRYTADITGEGRESPLLEGLAQSSFAVFQAHEKHVLLPLHSTEARILATDREGIIQIAQVARKVFGTQFHPEISRRQLDLWIKNAPGLKEKMPPSAVAAFEANYEDHKKFAHLLIENWLNNIVPEKDAGTTLVA